MTDSHQTGRNISFPLRVAAVALAGMFASSHALHAADDKQFDVVVYGGTSAGIAAAVQVKRMGGSVIVVEPGKRIGGLTTGGLGQTDIGNKSAIGGVSREFYQRVKKYYDEPTHWKWQKREEYRSGGQSRTGSNEDTLWTFEPSTALSIMQDLVREHEIPVVYQQRLDRGGEKKLATKQPREFRKRAAGVTMNGARIVAIKMESGESYRGRVFIDATYEGDLLAAAGVSYTVGRESNDTYDETLNGVQTRMSVHHQFVKGVDPYRKAGDPKSGLLPGIDPRGPGQEGAADHRVQAYCFRMCLTDHPDNRLPLSKPQNYDPLHYELLFRNFEAGATRIPWSHSNMPNRKTDINNNRGFSTDFIGQSYDYPEASHSEREKIIKRHRQYQQGLMWTLAHHPRVPEFVRREVSRWGPCRDEFEREDGWQQQLYIREARRMIGDVVMTQHHCQGRVEAERPIGMAAYTMDSHNVQRHVDADGHVKNEGDVQVGGFSPYPIDYGSIIPREDECDNLFVPVCLSASHMAFGSIRMEPVFMVLGQSAATAAMQALRSDVAIQRVDYSAIRERLEKDGQVLVWTGRKVTPAQAVAVDSLKGIAVDDMSADRTGFETVSRSVGPYVGVGYRHDQNTEKGSQRIRFRVKIPEGGMYDIRIAYTPHANRATNVPITILHGDEKVTARLNQRKKPTHGAFASVGRFSLRKGEAVVEIANTETDGYVIADAVQLLPVTGDAK